MDYVNLFKVEKYMIDYSKVNGFVNSIRVTDIDYLIKSFVTNQSVS